MGVSLGMSSANWFVWCLVDNAWVERFAAIDGWVELGQTRFKEPRVQALQASQIAVQKLQIERRFLRDLVQRFEFHLPV